MSSSNPLVNCMSRFFLCFNVVLLFDCRVQASRERYCIEGFSLHIPQRYVENLSAARSSSISSIVIGMFVYFAWSSIISYFPQFIVINHYANHMFSSQMR